MLVWETAILVCSFLPIFLSLSVTTTMYPISTVPDVLLVFILIHLNSRACSVQITVSNASLL